MCYEEDAPYPTPHQSSAVESWSDMTSEEDPSYPTAIGHQQLRVEMTCATRGTHPTLLPPHQSSAVESWSDMTSEEDPPYPMPPSVIMQLRVEMTWAIKRTHPTLLPLVISSWELKWHVLWGGPTLPYCPLISLQHLRVEVTWEMRRTHPTLPPIW